MGGLGIACLYAAIINRCDKIICIDMNKEEIKKNKKIKKCCKYL